MSNYGYIFISFLIFASCKKQKSFDFPTGNWKIINFSFKRELISENYKITVSNFDFNNLIYSLKYEGKNKLSFFCNGKEEIFKITKLDFNSNVSYFQLEGTSYTGYSNYSLTLKNRKGKRFLFEYCLINDSTLIGEFWEKGQEYFSFDAPNVQKIDFVKINPNVKGDLQSIYNTEILGVFKKQ